MNRDNKLNLPRQLYTLNHSAEYDERCKSASTMTYLHYEMSNTKSFRLWLYPPFETLMEKMAEKTCVMHWRQ